jgi:hypothetical protein
VKLSKLLLPLIPISFGLLLSIAKSGEPEKPAPKSKDSPLDNNKADKQPNPASEVTAVDQQPESPIDSTGTQRQMSKQEAQSSQRRDSSWWFNFLLVIFTGLLVFVGIGQIVVYGIQAHYMRQTLALANRPRIKIRAISVPNELLNSGDNPIQIRYELVNYGQTDATVLGSDHTIWLRHINTERPIVPPYNFPPHQIIEPGKVLKAGQSYKFQISHRVDDGQIPEFNLGHFRIHLLGYIDYSAGLGGRHRTAFARWLRTEPRDWSKEVYVAPIKFVPLDDPDYEYED